MKFVKINYVRVLITILIIGILLSCQTSTNTKTNVIIIMADDLGYGDLSCLGQQKLHTPNIDRLASEGMTFTNHYSGNTVCSPSRAVLMTGQDPSHVHCRGNVTSESDIALDSNMITLPRLFKNAGYSTGAFGKWGLGITTEKGSANPTNHGFDVFTGWKSQTIAHTYYPSSYVKNGNEIQIEQGTFVHDLIMEDAFNFIKDNAETGKPFFCYIPTAVPHAAMQAPEDLHNKWRKKLPQFENKIGQYNAGPNESCPDVINPIAGFAAMMENLDNQIGQILEILKESGVDDNTLIIFTSDNGAHSEGGHDPLYWNSNGDFRGLKRDLYEGGIHVPLLVRWPNKVSQGVKSNHISAFWDVIPTMAEIIGQPIPTQSDGISFLPSLSDNESEQKIHDYLYWEFTRGPKQKVVSQAVRLQEWKAVRGNWKNTNDKNDLLLAKESPIELYNLENDISEQNNVADEFPEIVKKIKDLMEAND